MRGMRTLVLLGLSLTLLAACPKNSEREDGSAVPSSQPSQASSQPVQEEAAEPSEEPAVQPADPAAVATVTGSLPKQGEKCPVGQCAVGLSCVEYYGVAGTKGPKLTSCEIACPKGQGDCPNGQLCVTVADGPGKVCRLQGPDKPKKLDDKLDEKQEKLK
jgi:hypothetical protein